MKILKTIIAVLCVIVLANSALAWKLSWSSHDIGKGKKVRLSRINTYVLKNSLQWPERKGFPAPVLEAKLGAKGDYFICLILADDSEGPEAWQVALNGKNMGTIVLKKEDNDYHAVLTDKPVALKGNETLKLTLTGKKLAFSRIAKIILIPAARRDAALKELAARELKAKDTVRQKNWDIVSVIGWRRREFTNPKGCISIDVARDPKKRIKQTGFEQELFETLPAQYITLTGPATDFQIEHDPIGHPGYSEPYVRFHMIDESGKFNNGKPFTVVSAITEKGYEASTISPTFTKLPVDWAGVPRVHVFGKPGNRNDWLAGDPTLDQKTTVTAYIIQVSGKTKDKNIKNWPVFYYVSKIDKSEEWDQEFLAHYADLGCIIPYHRTVVTSKEGIPCLVDSRTPGVLKPMKK